MLPESRVLSKFTREAGPAVLKLVKIPFLGNYAADIAVRIFLVKWNQPQSLALSVKA
jgi:hypothetical protein